MQDPPSFSRELWSRQLLASLLLAATFEIGAQAQPGNETALLAGGCFWTLQKVFDGVPGVVSTEVGFAGGRTANPTYSQVTSGGTGHLETVRIEFDPKTITYTELLDRYWHAIDPTRTDQQFCDVGRQYNPTVFVLNDTQRREAEQSRQALERSKPFRAAIRTPIVAAPTFWPAEENHQKFYQREPARYAVYERGCGRLERLTSLWGATATRPK